MPGGRGVYLVENPGRMSAELIWRNMKRRRGKEKNCDLNSLEEEKERVIV
jgi:hypothetical protein